MSFEPIDIPLVWPLGKGAAIAYCDNVFSEAFCSNLIKFCEEHPEKSFAGKTSSGVQLHIKVSQDWSIKTTEGISEENEFDKRLYDGLWRVLYLYKKSIPQMNLPWSDPYVFRSDSGYQIQKYAQCSGYYDEHVDGAPWYSYTSNRVLGVIVYLNTVCNGGETFFSLHNLDIAAIAGRVAIFPANWTHPHGGRMPMSSDKWIVSTFVFCGKDNEDVHVCTEECKQSIDGEQNLQNN